jgi:hypothetical protein
VVVNAVRSLQTVNQMAVQTPT